MITGIKFPELGNAQIRDVHADIFSSPSCRYDIILGRTELALMQLHLNFTTNTIEWRNHSIPMTPTQQLTTMYDDIEVFADEILDRKYQSVTPKEVVDTLDHLSQNEKEQLETVLNKYTTVFDGKLGRHPTAKYP